MNTSMFIDLEFAGSAVCKDYFGDYRLNGADGILINQISFTLDLCQQYGAPFEDSYFSFFSDAQTQTQLLTYNITGFGDDESLILTSQNGDFVTYGRQTLSVQENTINDLSVQLIENPVRNVINLDISKTIENSFNYEIFSIDGKHISKAKLNDTHSINVETLNSGLYFLVIFSENNYQQTLKFIKE